MAEEGENADEVIEKCSDVFLNGESENLDNIGEDEASLENEENTCTFRRAIFIRQLISGLISI